MAVSFRDTYGVIHRGLEEVHGSLLTVEGVEDVGYDELVKVRSPDGVDRIGRILEIGRGRAVIQIFGGEIGIQTDSIVSFTGSAFKIPLSEEVLGRIFNGIYEPLDHAP
ncbi:MAG: V-type ATP synthase subunit B, partial [Candidatus Bathyarchaeia archaeon]